MRSQHVEFFAVNGYLVTSELNFNYPRTICLLTERLNQVQFRFSYFKKLEKKFDKIFGKIKHRKCSVMRAEPITVIVSALSSIFSVTVTVVL